MRPAKSINEAYAMAIGMAIYTSLYVAGIGLIALVLQLILHGTHGLAHAIGKGLAGAFVLYVSYFAAALVGAPAYAVLYAVSDRWYGQVLMAGTLGFIILAAIGLAGALGYQYLGINLLDVTSTQDAWSSIMPVAGLGSLMAAVIGPIIWRLRRSDA
jgi:hypothetical protein